MFGRWDIAEININALKNVRERGYMDGANGVPAGQPFDIFAFSWCRDRDNYIDRIYGHMYKFAYLRGRRYFLSVNGRDGISDFIADRIDRARDLAYRGMAFGRVASEQGRSKAAIRDADLYRFIDKIRDNDMVQMVYDFWEYGYDTKELEKQIGDQSEYKSNRMSEIINSANADDVETDEALAAAVTAYRQIKTGLTCTERDDLVPCISCPTVYGRGMSGMEIPYAECNELCDESVEYLNIAFCCELQTIEDYVNNPCVREQDVYYDF